MKTDLAMSGINALYIVVFVCHIISSSTVCCGSPIILPTVKEATTQCHSEVIDEVKDTLQSILSNISMNSNKNAAPLSPLKDTSNSSRPVQITELFGARTGYAWDDNILSNMPTIIGIRNITISHEDKINSIQITYQLADGTLLVSPLRGNVAGEETSISLASDERITKVEGFTNTSSTTQLTFFAANSSGYERVFGPFGSIGKTNFTVSGYILGFRGYAREHINSLSIYYLMPLLRSESFGGSDNSTYAFDDNVHSIIPPVVGIQNITVRYGAVIDSIQSTYSLLGGSTYNGKVIGGNSGGIAIIQLEEGDTINRIIAKTSGIYVDNLDLFVHRSSSMSSQRFGTYGSDNGTATFEFSGVILGFYGYAIPHDEFGLLCSRIGVYTL